MATCRQLQNDVRTNSQIEPRHRLVVAAASRQNWRTKRGGLCGQDGAKINALQALQRASAASSKV